MSTAFNRRNPPRRGVTLVEMLVVVALVVLMMVILVQIFQSALGAMSASRTTQELDVVLRSIDSMIRSDLGGVTAKLTPPNDPALKQGYFEYGENAPADLQGEDTDDFLAFTTKAPEGQVFTGRQWLSQYVNGKPVINQAIQPTTITSQVAEVIYFLRNGNLYRRVFLVAPDRATSVSTTIKNPPNSTGTFQTSIFGGGLLNVSWQGMNDLSARPGGVNAAGALQPPILNDLGDLTNRENRAFRPRFMNDFQPLDGIPDDNNSDGVPDYYPTLYYNGNGGNSYLNGTIWSPNGLTNEAVGFPTNLLRVESTTSNAFDVYAFPFIFPGMYSAPEGSTVTQFNVTPPVNNLGWRHGMFPGQDPVSKNYYINHAPLDIGDNLPLPSQNQTWWGFPTWRETMTVYNQSTPSGWGDPIISVNLINPTYINPNFIHQQPLGLSPSAFFSTSSYGLLGNSALLPPITVLGSGAIPRFSDGAGSPSFTALPGIPNHLWEDDLILTHVRSFDIKAYDPDAPLYNIAASNVFFSSGYQDLGYDAANIGSGNLSNTPPLWQPNTIPLSVGLGGVPIGFGHEGRMPPIYNDYRLHPRRPTYVGTVNNTSTVLPYNVGDPNPNFPNSRPSRMVRTFDTWSTAYTNAPDSDILLNGYSVTGKSIYPSFPPPYPSPLRGIQIQIRVTDPRNERTKVLTIRQDFTDKL